MDDLVEKLNEPIIADAFDARWITSGTLAHRLILERQEAAARIEAQAAMLRECVEALEIASHMHADGLLHTPFATLAKRRIITTITRAKEMLK